MNVCYYKPGFTAYNTVASNGLDLSPNVPSYSSVGSYKVNEIARVKVEISRYVIRNCTPIYIICGLYTWNKKNKRWDRQFVNLDIAIVEYDDAHLEPVVYTPFVYVTYDIKIPLEFAIWVESHGFAICACSHIELELGMYTLSIEDGIIFIKQLRLSAPDNTLVEYSVYRCELPTRTCFDVITCRSALENCDQLPPIVTTPDMLRHETMFLPPGSTREKQQLTNEVTMAVEVLDK
jgi:hypothetical protein